MEREEVERILKEAGWKRIVTAPAEVVDYQRSQPYNRLILYKRDIEKFLTPDRLRKLMAETNLAKHFEILRGLGEEKPEEEVKEVSFIEDTEAKGKQRFLFNSEADAEICAVVMSQVMTGEHRFTSPVNYEEKGMFRVRGVLRPRMEKYGTPQMMNAADYENAWLLQQIFSWALEGTLRFTSVKLKENWVDVVWEKMELPVPEKEFKIYKVEEKRIDGRSWRITGEKK